MLDMKRATSVGVLMGRVRMPAHQLVRAMYELDTDVRFFASSALFPLLLAFDGHDIAGSAVVPLD